MGACRLLPRLLSYGFFISSFISMLSFYGWDMSQRLREKRIHQENEDRMKLINEMCHLEKKTFLEQSYHNLLVDDTHGLIYCYIPKVACTNLKRIMIVLKKGEPYGNPNNITGDIHDRLLRLEHLPTKEIKVKLKHYTKFMFSRDPFIRLISAYRNKFEELNEPFYKDYGRDILRLYGKHLNPPKTMKEALASGIRISFYNFIQYLLDPRTEQRNPFEPHWRQMHRLCHPCLIQYDLIGHQETMQEDTEHLLKILKLQDDIKVPSAYVNVTTNDSVMKWFKTVPLEDRRKLYKIYEKDFKLFGYRKPDELLKG
ncbi:carbohydrate sulfotransferase 12-like [Solea solea]|uniref:carbohydrate sulfotransferase 12-like n=1 Tax=Solea solea TaxID=90069 RepID=UPI00272D1C72|nr:carbohydrate sulfotransferase 12-like [Solea solea]